MIDFNSLTDDQLVSLIREACSEAIDRGAAVEQAARSAMLSQAEKARIKTEEAEKAAAEHRKKEEERLRKEAREKVKREAEKEKREAEKEKQRRFWSKKKAAALALVPLLGKGSDFHVSVWNKKDKRVYIDPKKYGGGSWKVTYYAEGNGKNPKGTFQLKGFGQGYEHRDAIKEVCRQLAEDWNSLRYKAESALNEEAQIEVFGEHAEAYGLKKEAA